MIALKRVRANVPGSLAGADRRDKERTLMTRRREYFADKNKDTKKRMYKSSWWGAAKDALYLETHDKCAYCEASTKAVSHGDVEHYRPKAVYWWLAYCLDNYLVSCQKCNQTFKSDHFPVSGARLKAPARITGSSTDAYIDQKIDSLAPDPQSGPQTAKFAAEHASEGAKLVNPYFDNPALFFAWQADDVLREVDLIPANNKAGTKARVDAAIAFYGLNRKELRSLRYTYYPGYVSVRDLLRAGTPLSPQILGRARGSLALMTADTQPFAAMMRYFARQDRLIPP